MSGDRSAETGRNVIPAKKIAKITVEWMTRDNSSAFRLFRRSLAVCKLGEQELDFIINGVSPSPFQGGTGEGDWERMITRKQNTCYTAVKKKNFLSFRPRSSIQLVSVTNVRFVAHI
jgi:hypothetical protein